MQQKLPENIDQLDGFYKEQFNDFSPEVSDAVWKNISNNIPVSTGLRTSVSTTYLLKVVGVMLGGIIAIAVVSDSFKTNTQKPVPKEIITPSTPTEVIQPEGLDTINEKMEVVAMPVSESSVEKPVTTSKKVKKTVNQVEKKNKKEETPANFQFVEELKLEE